MRNKLKRHALIHSLIMLYVTSNPAMHPTPCVGYGGTETLNSQLLYYWPLDEASGDRVDSVSGKILTDWDGDLDSAAGVSGNAANFAVENDSRELVEEDYWAFKTTSDFTVSIWAYLDPAATDGTDHGIFWMDWDIISIWENSGTMTFQIWDHSVLNTNRIGTFAFSKGAWHNLVFQKYGNAFNVFLDGVNVLTFDVTGFVISAPGGDTYTNMRFAVGNQLEGSMSWLGQVDEVKIWQRALRLDEILALIPIPSVIVSSKDNGDGTFELMWVANFSCDEFALFKWNEGTQSWDTVQDLTGSYVTETVGSGLYCVAGHSTTEDDYFFSDIVASAPRISVYHQAGYGAAFWNSTVVTTTTWDIISPGSPTKGTPVPLSVALSIPADQQSYFPAGLQPTSGFVRGFDGTNYFYSNLSKF